MIKRHGSLEGPRDVGQKQASFENSFLTEKSLDSINKSYDGLHELNSSLQEFSRLEANDELLQKSAVLNQSIDSFGVIPHNLNNVKKLGFEELAEYAKMQYSPCLLNNRNKNELNEQISRMIHNQNIKTTISVRNNDFNLYQKDCNALN